MVSEKSVNTTIDLDLNFQLEALTQKCIGFEKNKLESEELYKSLTGTEMYIRAEN